MVAHQVRVIRLAAGHAENPSVEASAGALLAAEAELKICDMHTMMNSYIKALNESNAG